MELPKSSSNTLGFWLGILFALPAAAQSPDPADGEEVLELEAFIVAETAGQYEDSVMPTTRPVESVFGQPIELVDLPRSVTVVNPELMQQLQIDDFTDLDKIGPGTQRYNFYGISGTPALRGWEAGTYFNGMLRAYQRNSMPMSFGSLEALDLVRGVAPAHYPPTNVGGFVNFVPKQPYFDEFRGSVRFSIGSYDYYNGQVDVGGPFLLFGSKPAAYRVSVTAQEDGTFYERVHNDYQSIYASIKVRVKEDVSIFTGGEFYNYQSNENVGWNRPTQELVDHGDYLIGGPLSLRRASWGGRYDRNLVDNLTNGVGGPPGSFTTAPFTDPPQRAAFRALVVPESVAAARIPAALRSEMINLAAPSASDPSRANWEVLYDGLPADVIPTTSGYVYTPEYFAAGGEPLTEEIDASDVLSDEDDFADSMDFLYFFDWVNTQNPDRVVKNQALLEYLDSEKRSSYGYAINVEQFVFADRFSIEQHFDLRDRPAALTYGGEFRFTTATHLEDFWTEPFSRRDISNNDINPNTTTLAGGQTDPQNGVNFWAGGIHPFGGVGTNIESDLFQYAAFGLLDVELTDRLSTYIGLRGEIARFETRLPDEVDFNFQGPRPKDKTGQKNYVNFGINPVYKLTPNINLYGALQLGTTYTPSNGGAVRGEEAFAEAELYEVGLKTSFFEDRLYTAVSLYYWDQGSYDERNQTPEQYRAEGIEVETAFDATERLTFLASFNAQEVYRRNPLGYRSGYFGDAPGANGDAEQGVALNGGVFNPDFGGVPARNPDLEVPGLPEVTAKLFAVYTLPSGWGVSGGPIWRDSYWHNYDHTIKLPDSVIWSGSIFYRSERFELMFTVENIFDEDYYYGADPEFAANTLLVKAPGPEARLSLTYKF